ncbi:MAG: hypothetical protein P1T08_13250 [Acidimicrobiia bacterium]|nr:hypothetical protein [Acidimicrobiia bacterium]
MAEQLNAAELTDDPPQGLKRLMTRIIPTRPPKLDPRRSILDGADPGPVPTEPAEFAVALAAAQFLVAEHIASNERDEKRRQKMDRVVQIQRETLNALRTPNGPTLDPGAAVGSMTAAEPDTRITFLIEVFFLDPFSPYSLRYRGKIRRRALQRLAPLVGEDKKVIRRIEKAGTDAKKSHSTQNWGKVGLVGVGAAVVLGLGGFMAAPLFGAALGAAAGLSGAAATAHGLALLGGGALAAGGAGMAGGMWMVAGAGAALGVVGGGGGIKLFQLGAAQARGELVKLQVTYKLTLLQGQTDLVKAQAVIEDLAGQAEELKGTVAEERLLNDENSKRVTDLEETLEALEETILWMRSQEDDLE